MIIRIGKKTYHFINRYENLRQFVVYFFIGGTSALSDLILLFIFVDLFKIYYLIAATLSFIIVASIAFFFHKKFTFRFEGKRNKFRFLIFLFTAGTGLLWSILILFTLVEFFHLWYLLAAVITKFIVLTWNFLVNKFVTFRKLKSEKKFDIYV